MPRISLERVTKSYPQPGSGRQSAVRELSLAVEDGEWLVLAGPSGSGKTTTLRLIAGLEHPDAGSIAFDGQVVNQVPAGKRDVAMVFQTLALYPHMTARENIAFGLRVRGFSRKDLQSTIEEMLTVLRLEGCEGKKPDELSGGERQRVAIARALARRPGVLLFDEPMSNLDTPLRAELRREFGRLRDVYRGTVIYVTHDQADAMVLGDRIALLKSGELQQLASPQEIWRTPANRFVAGFFGSPQMNLLEGKLAAHGGRLWFESGDIRVALKPHILSAAPGTAVVLGIRPEHVNIRNSQRTETAGSADSNGISGTVLRCQKIGAEVHLAVQIGGVEVVASVRGDWVGAVGDSVQLVGDSSRICLFDAASGRRLLPAEPA